jgi:hypothetical protein
MVGAFCDGSRSRWPWTAADRHCHIVRIGYQRHIFG